MKTTETIEAIVSAAKRPMPEIVEIIYLGGDNGKFYSVWGFPVGVKSTGERKSMGFGVRWNDGTTHCTINKYPTRESIEEYYKEREEIDAETFRAHLSKCTAKELKSQANYWLKR
jgi:hypothetical protein